ncbi:MAG: hypothetical protein F9K13_06520 [Candidatus Methylomirabilis oxygeniifera]|uniref:DUF5666 domain-containing protein n=1 Tax=Methylomirabilis oxygeniifera TaxID=671143 RepID=D5MHH2_METO1|nr:MAG: hypothetical protein F9K13_06520 [Candidatus Methylomirabilis oxyfera]CBE69204.1 exported protein of unknown function [Candidatus Methylomirabilis oxyfera]
MKRWPTFTPTLTILVAFTELSAAQERKAWEKPVEKPTQGKLPFVGKQQLMTGKVTQANPTTNTFTVMAKGQMVTFNGANLNALPRVGEIIEITYTQTSGGPMQATTINSTKSNTF